VGNRNSQHPAAREPTKDDDLEAGQLLGSYTLLRPLSRGGMGSVWIAQLEGTRGFHKLVALKTMLPRLRESGDHEKQFFDEAMAAAAVQHPNVCHVLDFGLEDGRLFMVMELVDGTTLARLLRRSPQRRLPAPLAARILADACAGLAAVHEARDAKGKSLGIVHRDVSPQNILVARDGHVKLADFGVVRSEAQLHDRTATGIIKGKAHYLSPEQALGQRADARSDVFATGCVLYQSLTGRRPFEGVDLTTVLRRVRQGLLLPPSHLVPDLPKDLEEIVMQALAASPAARTPSARALGAALDEWLLRHARETGRDAVAREMNLRLGEEASSVHLAVPSRALRSSVPPPPADDTPTVPNTAATATLETAGATEPLPPPSAAVEPVRARRAGPSALILAGLVLALAALAILWVRTS
jgi:serine/threonine protein kinase